MHVDFLFWGGLGHDDVFRLWARKDANENGFDMALLTLWAQVHVVTKSGTDTVIVDTASGAWTGAAGTVPPARSP